jgi:DASH complex subunit ASK1
MDDSALHAADADDAGHGASGDSALEHASGASISQTYGTDEDEDDTITSPPSATQRRVAAAAAGIASSDDGDAKRDDDSDVAALLSSPSLAHSHSTPRQPASHRRRRPLVVEDRPSPYEAMRREMRGEPASAARAAAPTTPGKRPPALPDMNMTPTGSSPFAVPTTAREANKDTILHQGILGRTYRVAATPLTSQRTLRMFGNDGRDRGGLSSPEMDDDDDDEPQLRAEIFSSPVRPARNPAPGTSVLTPRRKGAVEWRREERRRSSKGLIRGEDAEERRPGGEEGERGRGGYTARSVLDWASDDDEEELPEMSPPKTMRFDFGGQPVIQTPGLCFQLEQKPANCCSEGGQSKDCPGSSLFGRGRYG